MTPLVRLTRFAQHLLTFFLHFAHGGFVMAGVIVMAGMTYQLGRFGVDGLNPREMFGYGQQMVETTEVAMVDAVYEEAVAEHSRGMSAGHARVAAAIAKRHRVSPLVVETLVKAAQREGQANGVDPLLILAVITVESGFNPFAESNFGAQGLMQIIPRFHVEKITAEKGSVALFDPVENIRVGTLILREYIRSTGSVDAALQLYGGASADPEMAYSSRVMQEFERLRGFVAAPATRTAARSAIDKAS
ncbi:MULTISPECIES: transglycosylase SLT domain-containing protein [unclassified Uliginosibacterium]|uniref:transglycosylase SLT domain-containing protein n=1 Tax=unclassified Uliginosibacterium TaxID=2621521 RepID=UPI000C7BCA2D|nr:MULTISPECIES: transglycosylase SLT domain-containing protein [unclassified Uliginosibacterium]MDO6384728.1 transglycosylase SLT domain-containing protein [Uliginosibacterium sp. 31-12]PLK48422.1 transglycosylase [Uliginosibacterium sp. TH139]